MQLSTRPLLFLLTATLLLIDCSYLNRRNGNGDDGVLRARAEVRGFTPRTIKGTIEFRESRIEGLRITGEVFGFLPESTYAVHIHEIGDCANPDAPGGHFDPGGSGTHGFPGGSPGQHHAGDLPNVKADGDGKLVIDHTTNALDAGQTPYSVIGRSIVIHSRPDDYTAQPAGNSGDRIACGVIQSAKE